MDNSHINPLRFLMFWILNSALIWPIAAMVCIFALIPFAMIYSIISLGFVAPMIEWSITVFLLVFLSTLIAYVIGERQEQLVEKHLQWTLYGWTRWSILGGALGGLALVAKAWLLQSVVSEQVFLMLNMPLFILCLSIAQWQVLRKMTRESWLWVFGNFVGGIVFSGVLLLNQPTSVHPLYMWLMIGLWAFATFAQSAITGIIILWLYDRPLGEWNDEDAEAVPVYVEVRTRSNKNE